MSITIAKVLIQIASYLSLLWLINVWIVNTFSNRINIIEYGKSRVTHVLHKETKVKDKIIIGSNNRLALDVIQYISSGKDVYVIEEGENLDKIQRTKSTTQTSRGFNIQLEDVDEIKKHYINSYYGERDTILNNTYVGYGIGSNNIRTLENAIWEHIMFTVIIVEICIVIGVMVTYTKS